MPYRFRHAVCNEVFEKRPFANACRAIHEAGYNGIEIAPFTLAEDPVSISAAQRREYRSIMESEGLEFAGLHWLLASPPGLHVTTPDTKVRERSWQYFRGVIDLCADLGPHGIMVFGSPKQRSSTGGLDSKQSTTHLVDGLAAVASHASERGVTILLEALPKSACDVVTTLDEAAAIVRQIASPAIQTMFDTHNAIDETEPHASLVEKHYDLIRHLHVNEMDGRHPGTGSYDFKPVLEVLRRRSFPGWVSLEVFDFSAGADQIVSNSLRFLELEIRKLPQ